MDMLQCCISIRYNLMYLKHRLQGNLLGLCSDAFYVLKKNIEKRIDAMLRGIPKILPPDLIKYMMEMGHSDFLVIADANFPGTAHAKNIIRMDSVSIVELLEAILPLYPLDSFVSNSVKLMRNLSTEPTPKYGIHIARLLHLVIKIMRLKSLNMSIGSISID